MSERPGISERGEHIAIALIIAVVVLAFMFSYVWSDYQADRIREQARTSVYCELAGVDFSELSAPNEFSFTVRCKLPTGE